MSLTRGVALKLHKFTFNSKVYTVRLPDIYDGLSGDTGIEEVANGERPDTLGRHYFKGGAARWQINSLARILFRRHEAKSQQHHLSFYQN